MEFNRGESSSETQGIEHTKRTSVESEKQFLYVKTHAEGFTAQAITGSYDCPIITCTGFLGSDKINVGS